MTTLYRKYQPKKFDEVLGQDIIIKIMLNLLKKKEFHHCILLSGSYGVGKTSLARIFAKAMNCYQENNPCLNCEGCKNAENSSDITELDAATYSGVDNIRQIIDDTQYLPLNLKYKIYIIDEIHMLSKSAFNALLKTLEEPNEYVKFIFATTEKYKIPDTVLSRCLQLDLNKLSPNNLANYIKKICSLENYDISKEVIQLIIDYSEGSARNVLAFLEKIFLINNSSKFISTNECEMMLKIVSKHSAVQLFSKICKGQSKEAVEYWQDLRNQGYSPKDMLNKISEVLFNLFLLKENTKLDIDDSIIGILQEHNISHKLLIGFWEIVISQLEALFYGSNYSIETLITMMILLEERTNIVKEVNKVFPSLKLL